MTIESERACLWISHNTLFWKFQDTLSQWQHKYDIDWEFLGIPVENCIVGVLLTCPTTIQKSLMNHEAWTQKTHKH